MRSSSGIFPKVLLPFVFFATTLMCAAQYPSNADTLRMLIRSAPHDTTKAQAMLFLAVLLHQSNPDTVPVLCMSCNKITDDKLGKLLVLGPKERKAYNRLKATCLLNMGHYHHDRGDDLAAMGRYDLALQLFHKAGFWRGAGDAYAAMDAILKETGSAGDAKEWVLRAKHKYECAPNVSYGSIGYRSATPNSQGSSIQNKTEPDMDRAGIGDKSELAVALPPPWKSLEESLIMVIPDVGSIVLAADNTPDGAPLILDSSTVGVNVVASLTELGIDTAQIAKYRNRLYHPIREDGGAMEANDYLEQGEALELIREPGLAMVSFMRSLDVFRIMRSDTGECVALLRIGNLQGAQGKYEEAFDVLDSARRKARTIGRHDLEGLALAGMGDMCRRIEECGRAADLYRKSIELALAAGDKRTEARGYLGVTEDLVERGSLKEAEPLGLKGLDIATVLNDAELRQQGAALLRGVYTRLGRAVEAQEMGILADRFEAIIAEKDRVLDSIITAMQTDFAIRLEHNSLTNIEVRTTLETNLMVESGKARKNKKAVFMIAACALAAILSGIVYYRFDRRRRQIRADRRATELEIRALRAQMNPHFLFNALNSINDYVQENKAQLASDYLTRFAKLMRQVLEASRQDDIPLSADLAILRQYIELEQMRLQGKFDFVINVSPEVDAEMTMVPPMILQPFVENAVWHGLSKKVGKGVLTVEVAEGNGGLLFSVQDDGLGRATKGVADKWHHSLGLGITQERLQRIAHEQGNRGRFVFVPVSEGTLVQVHVPMPKNIT